MDKGNGVENNTTVIIVPLYSGGILCPFMDYNSMTGSWAGK